MTTQSEELLQTALALPEGDRAAIAASLIRSLDSEIEEDTEAAWADEMQRRLAEIDRGEVQLIPWNEVIEELRGRMAF